MLQKLQTWLRLDKSSKNPNNNSGKMFLSHTERDRKIKDGGRNVDQTHARHSICFRPSSCYAKLTFASLVCQHAKQQTLPTPSCKKLINMNKSADEMTKNNCLCELTQLNLLWGEAWLTHANIWLRTGSDFFSPEQKSDRSVRLVH